MHMDRLGKNNKYKHFLNRTLRPGPRMFPNFKAGSYHVDVCISGLVLGGRMYPLLYAARLVSAAVSFLNGLAAARSCDAS